MTIRLLFVCTGNICRSPTAEGICLAKVAKGSFQHDFHVDSVGLFDYHEGEQADSRTREVAAENGVDLEPLRARQITQSDLGAFDWYIAMDAGHVARLKRLLPVDSHDRIRLMLSFSGVEGDVPDPYYGPMTGFHHVFDMLNHAVENMLNQLDAETP